MLKQFSASLILQKQMNLKKFERTILLFQKRENSLRLQPSEIFILIPKFLQQITYIVVIQT
jgi:hypothetical protein